MASEKLQKILAMSKNIDKKGSKMTQSPKKTMQTPISMYEQMQRADKQIANIDAAYNSPYIPSQEEKETWNTERGREELTEMADRSAFLKKLENSRLPAAIIESMKSNPCNYDVETVNGMMGPENALFKKLNEAYGKEKQEPVRGVKALNQINEQLDKRDREKAERNGQLSEMTNTAEVKTSQSFDLDLLEQVIERVIDRKMNALNETISRDGNQSIKMMSLTENGNFRFLDNDGNVYECQMKYLGKRKKKS